MNRLDTRYLVLFLVGLLLQFTFINFIEILHWRPDLILIILVSFALRRGPNLGMTVGFLAGLTQDIISTHFIGLAALSKTAAGFLAGVLAGKFSERTEFFLSLLICSLAHDLLYFFIYTLGENFSLQSLIILYTIPNVMYTIIIGVFYYYVVDPLIAE